MKSLSLTICIVAGLLAPECAAKYIVTIDRAYGERASYSGAVIRYPDFSLKFIEKREKQGSGPFYTAYVFHLLDKKDSKKIGEVTFVMSGLYDCPDFVLAGKKYIMEMFDTTSDEPYPLAIPGKSSGEMKEDEVLIWDEPTAKQRNPNLYHWINERRKRPNR